MLKILTEASFEYGFGHFYRMSSICEAAIKNGFKAGMFIDSDEAARNSLQRSYTFFTDWINDLVFLDSIGKSDIVVVDSYHVGMDVLESLRESAGKLIIIDDNIRLPYKKMNVLNPNYFAVSLDYPKSNDNTYYLGKDYTLLREPFYQPYEKDVRSEVSDILVTMGGTDVLDISGSVVSAINKIRDEHVRIHLVATKAFRNLEEIKSVLGSQDECHIDIDSAEMCDLMKKCDFAVSAAGGTTNELIKMQCPSIVIIVADNQRLNVEYLSNEGYVRTFDLKSIDNIKSMFGYDVRNSIVNKLNRLKSDYSATSLILDFLKEDN